MEIGSYAYDKTTNSTVQIIEKINAWDYSSYKVYNSSTGQIYKVPEEQLTDIRTSNYDENYVRFVAYLSKVRNEISGGFISTLSNNIIPLPHQLHVLDKALSGDKIRYILADEVGLGKTIEAGMVIQELKSRGLVKRTLVVCPTGLVTQWSLEMKQKFNEDFNIILPSDYDTIRRLSSNKDVYGQYDQVISPMDSIKPIERHAGWTEEKIEQYNNERIDAIINSGWDLIIIDEAHRVAGSSSDVARYKLGHRLSQASPYLLLLSATPHNGKSEPFLRLIRLLDEDAFPNANSIIKEQVAPYLIRTEKREAIDNKGEKLFKNRITHLVSLNWDTKYSQQIELYNRVTDYVSKTYNKAIKNRKQNMCLIFLLIIMQRMVTSSTSAIKQSLERRLEVLKNQETKYTSLKEEDLGELNIEDNIEDVIEAMSVDTKTEIAELEEIIAIARQAEYQNKDVKVEKLLDTISKIFNEDRNKKIIIFTEFVATQEYLRQILSNSGYKVSVLNGSMSIEERNEALNDFKNNTDIFISTDAGGEGLNLQFSNIIINYDLPWNPMKIEQRCGRADRIGQKYDVHIYNFIVADTVENRVREVLEQKLSTILNEIGIDKYSDVLDSNAAEYNFTDVYMHSISHPLKIEQAVSSAERELKQQIENIKKYKNVIKEDKDLMPFMNEKPASDIKNDISEMLKYYEKYYSKKPLINKNFAINDPQILKIIESDINLSQNTEVPFVTIKDFPNEPGYFMLWQIINTNIPNDSYTIPVFITKDFTLRPIAGNKIFEAFLNKDIVLNVENTTDNINDYDKLKSISMDLLYNKFLELKDNKIKKIKESHDKYLYAIKLRLEAAQQIGIENIRISRINKLMIEKDNLEKSYLTNLQICPECKLIMFLELGVSDVK